MPNPIKEYGIEDSTTFSVKSLYLFIFKCIHMYILEKYSKMKFTIFSFEQNMNKITMVI